MKKQSVLYILLIFLILSNAFFLFQFIGKKDSNKGKPEDFIVKQLKFNDNQLEAYNTLRLSHIETIKSINDQTRLLKDEMFSKISESNVSQTYIDSITGLIGAQEMQKDKELFMHFLKVRDICNERQKEKLKKILKDALRRGGERKGPPPNGPGGHRPPPRH